MSISILSTILSCRSIESGIDDTFTAVFSDTSLLRPRRTEARRLEVALRPNRCRCYCYTNGTARHAAGITHATETAFDYASNCSRPFPLWHSACILLLLRLLRWFPA